MTVAYMRAELGVIDQAVAEHKPSHVFAMLSGGDDSLTSTSIAAKHPSFRGVVHLNTGIGIEETREFVRETCRREGWLLIERWPPRMTYERHVLLHGMPGGTFKHSIMYHRLKQEALELIVKEHKQHRRDRIAFVTGIRKQESVRRMKGVIAVPISREGARVWVAPILDWSKIDCLKHLEREGLPRNPVSINLHRSGECLCGALADPRELDVIAFFYPKVGAHIRDLERQCFEKRLPYAWGRDPSQPFDDNQSMMPLCQSCATRWEQPA